jgi:hypothetical protein
VKFDVLLVFHYESVDIKDLEKVVAGVHNEKRKGSGED